MGQVLSSAAGVTPEYLTEALRRAGVLERGEVVRVELHPLPGRKADIAVPLRVDYANGGDAPTRLFFKVTTRSTEIPFHEQIAGAMPDGPVLRCYDAAWEGERGHLILEDASEMHYTAPEVVSPTLDESEKMLDALAQLHACWWEHPRLRGNIGELAAGHNTIAFIKGRIAETFGGFVDFMGDRLSAERRRIYELILDRWPTAALLERLRERRQVTINHGDPHAQNFLLPRDPSIHKTVGIDWADWRIQTGPRDVSFLIAPEFYPERRQRFEAGLVRYYHERLLAYGVGNYDWDTCWQDYRMGVIGQVLMPVFWYSWSPPEIWWPTMEKTLLAFDDLKCEELL